MKFLSLAATEIVKMTFSDVAIDENFVNMTTLFQCRTTPDIQHYLFKALIQYCDTG